MLLAHNGYEISIIEEGTGYPFDFDKRFNSVIDVARNDDFDNWFVITVNKKGAEKKMLLKASWYTPIENMAALHKDGIIMLLDNIICIFNPETLEIVREKKIKTQTPMLGIYKYKDDYILHGEIEVFRMDSNMNILWNYSNYDVYVTRTGEQGSIELIEDRICLSDNCGNRYEIDYNGNELYRHINSSIDIHARRKMPLLEQISLNDELRKALSEEPIDLDLVRNLLKKGANPLGYYELNNWFDTPYGDYILDCQRYEKEDLDREGQLPDVTKLLLEYGMDVEAVRFDVMHSFTWLRHSDGLKGLYHLLENGLSAGFSDGFVADMVGDMMQFEDPYDQVARIEYASKMTMLIAAFHHDKIDECRNLKKLIEPENNDLSVLERFKDADDFVHQIVSVDMLEWDFTKVCIFDRNTRKKVWEYYFKSFVEHNK